MGNGNQAKLTKSKMERFFKFLKVIASPVREWVIAIVAFLTLIGVIVGVRTYHLEREKEAAARYLNIIRELGNNSNSVRSGAVITMDAYLERSDKNYKKYREQGIYVLVNHLAVEKSPLVRATIQDVLANRGVKEDIVIQKLATANRHLWEQRDLTPDAVIRGDPVSDNLQSIADTLIKIFRRKKTITLNLDPPKTLDLSKVYLMSDVYPLKDVNFVNVQLEGACLVRMNLEECTMEECKLSGALLDDAILREAKLAGVELKNAYLGGAYLGGADLEGADLEGADLEGANLEDANLAGANLTEAILEDANLAGVILEGAILNNAILTRADLTGAILTKAILKGANLEDAKLEGTILEGANLEGANLEGADLRAAVLLRIDSEKFQSDLDKGTISEGLQQEFEDNGIYLSQNTTVSIEEKDRRWLINDKDNEQTYTVRKEEGQLNICKETKFDFTDIKKAKNWKDAIFDDDVRQKLLSQQN